MRVRASSNTKKTFPAVNWFNQIPLLSENLARRFAEKKCAKKVARELGGGYLLKIAKATSSPEAVQEVNAAVNSLILLYSVGKGGMAADSLLSPKKMVECLVMVADMGSLNRDEQGVIGLARIVKEIAANYKPAIEAGDNARIRYYERLSKIILPFLVPIAAWSGEKKIYFSKVLEEIRSNDPNIVQRAWSIASV